MNILSLPGIEPKFLGPAAHNLDAIPTVPSHSHYNRLLRKQGYPWSQHGGYQKQDLFLSSGKGKVKKIKLSLKQAVKAHRVVRRRGFHIF
jgi:hypothetical protein